MMNWSATSFYYNEYAELIGHDAEQVRAWLAAHPNYVGHIWQNYGQDDPDMDVTEIFIAEEADSSIAAGYVERAVA